MEEHILLFLWNIVIEKTKHNEWPWSDKRCSAHLHTHAKQKQHVKAKKLILKLSTEDYSTGYTGPVILVHLLDL